LFGYRRHLGEAGAMIDFPASPNVGDTFTSGGLSWKWDGAKWAATGGSGTFLPLAGGTLTGNLAIAPAGSAQLTLNRSAASMNSMLDFQSASSDRWRLYAPTNEGEPGGNAGSNFQLWRFDDSGLSLGATFTINRATGAAVFSGSLAAASISAPQAMGDNRIINGDMRIDQRNQGALVTGSAGGYSVDRWAVAVTQTAKGTWGRGFSSTSLAVGFPYYWVFTSTSAYTPVASDNFAFYQVIEADNVSDFCFGTAAAQPITLSFWVYATVAGTYSGAIRNQPSPPTRSYPFTFTPTANAWTKIVVTIPGDTAGTWVTSGNAGGLQLTFDLGCGATLRGPPNAWASATYVGATGATSIVSTNGAQLAFTGVKIELGSIATPYNRQSLARIVIDCQRYFRSWKPGLANGDIAQFIGSGTTTQGFSFHFLDTPMRAAPSISASGNFIAWQVASGSPAATFSSASGMTNFSWYCTWAATGLTAAAPGILRDADGTAALWASAEL
jgi:hypothetical protein